MPSANANMWSRDANDILSLTIRGDVESSLTVTTFDISDRIIYDCECPATMCSISKIEILKVTDANDK